MRFTVHRSLLAGSVAAALVPPVAAQDRDGVFALGEIVVVGERPDALSSVGGSVVTREQAWTFERLSLEQAVNLAPGVVSTRAGGGQRNESDIFVRGFNRLQVPLMIDGVRIYLPADNRIDFARFLTADIAAVQIQKGYASVLDGPGAMGGAINLVTGKPTEAFQAEGGLSFGGRGGAEAANGYMLMGGVRENFYVQGSLTFADRDSWTMSDDYVPTPNSLEDGGERNGSDTEDWRLNFKIGFTPSDTNEYVVNYTKQEGEKGAPLNVYNNPPVPGNSYWRWPYWDVQNLSFLSTTQLGDDAYLKSKVYYNTFENGLDAYDNATYTTQSANGRFHSPYDDHAYGTTVEYGTTRFGGNTLKFSLYYRTDEHSEYNINQPTSPARNVEPKQRQEQQTWSVAAENTFHINDDMDFVAGISYDDYEVKRAEELFGGVLGQWPLGGADAFNWQSAFVWRYSGSAQFHASISDRARFPTIFELYSQGMGTRTPNPNLGAESATNVEVGWEKTLTDARIGGAVFYSDVDDLIQSVILPNTTTQQQNVGNGRFVGLEVSGDIRLAGAWRLGGNYTFIDREIEDASIPNLRPTGVPENKLFFYAEWRPTARLSLTPSVEAADDRWSDRNPAAIAGFPYVETGEHSLVNLDVKYTVRNIEVGVGARNLGDENYELAWGYPMMGRNYYAKVRLTF